MRGAALVVFAAAMTLALYFALRPEEQGPPGFDTVAPRAARVFRGIVRAGGVPVAGARVTPYERGAGARGAGEPATTAEDGTFIVRWEPRTTTDRRELFVYARLGDRESLAPARPGRIELDLAAPATAPVAVVDRRGRPLPDARVFAALRHGRALGPVDGTLTAPEGMPLDLVVTAPGFASRVERRFSGGEPVRVHLPPGRPARVLVRDPDGRPVAGARVRLGGPESLAAHLPSVKTGPDGRAALPDASDGAGAYLAVEREGFLRAGAPAWPGRERLVVLWPRRDLEVLVWDGARRRGIETARLRVHLDPVNNTGDWYGGRNDALVRDTAVRPGRGEGLYVAAVPRAPLLLTVIADGYPEETVEVGEDARRLRVRLTPPRRRSRPGRIELVAEGHEGELPVAVADPAGRFHTIAWLRNGRAAARVPPDTDLAVASVRAGAGVWLPLVEIGEVGEGKTRRVEVGLLPAARMTVVTEPPAEGVVVVKDLAYKRDAARLEAPLENGRATFWVRPRRELRLSVSPEGNFRPEDGEFKAAGEAFEHVVRLRRGAGARWRIVDAAGDPVPFARVRLWEPGLGGEPRLRRPPRHARADASGRVALLGLRGGRAVVEFRASTFRSVRLGSLPLEAGAVLPEAVIPLSPAPYRRGVVRSGGEPLGGAGLVVLWPRIAPLETPGGGRRLVWELARVERRHARTAADGSFRVRDESPENDAPLLLVDPRRPGDFATGAAPLDVENPKSPVEFDLPRLAWIEVDVSGRVDGVYVMLPAGRNALLVAIDRSIGMRPLPVKLPAGSHSLYLRMADGRWAARQVRLAPGQTFRWTPRLRR